MPEWQPIETAPKDGARIDVGGFTRGQWFRAPDCYWHRKNGRWVSKWQDSDGYSALRLPFTPTHWMPLPTPPVSA